MKKILSQDGFTLIEIIIFIGLAVGIMLVVSGFVSSIASVRNYFGDTLTVEEDVSKAMSEIIRDIRSMGQSNVGNYPIEAASDTALIFYSDTNQDNLFERIRYFVSGSSLQKGVITPSGSPLEYVSGNEVVREIISGLATSTVFSYFDGNYAGTSSPMTLPVNVAGVRMIRATLSVDNDPFLDPGPLTFSRQSNLRNLRTNL